MLQREAQERLQERIRTGRWHDGRLDCVAGNGVMSELGIGDELFGDDDADPTPMANTAVQLSEKGKAASEKLPGPRGDEERRQTSSDDVPTIKSMPIVIVKGFETKGGGQNKQEMLDVIAHWVATLAQNQVRCAVISF